MLLEKTVLPQKGLPYFDYRLAIVRYFSKLENALILLLGFHCLLLELLVGDLQLSCT